MFLEFLTSDGAVVPFPSLKFRVGSAATCEVQFAGLEPLHAEVWSENSGNNWKLRALCTDQLGVLLNGSTTREARLTHGSKLVLGEVSLEVRLTRATPTGVIPAEVSPSRARAQFLAPGTVIDRRYEVVERIASGGMGQVYRALHVELRKPLAVKVMLPSLSDNQDFVARFKREAIAVSRIGQENIVDVSDFGRTEDGRFYFVMELVEGLTLAQALKHDGPFSPARTIRVATQVARALAAAHAAGVVHRDLKPENVMLVQRANQPDFVKVLDFGVAKVQASGTTQFGGQTAVGMVVGTPQYMPPEQARGELIDGRTDVYTLGLIMHELLMGRPCFRGDSPAALIMMQLSAEPPPLALPNMPDGLEALVLQTLRKKAPDRPASMQDVLARLDAVSAGNAHGRPAQAPSPAPAQSSESATVRMEAPNLTRLAPLTALPPPVTAAPVVPSGVPSAVANIRLPPSSVDIAPAPLPSPAAPARARAAAAPGRRPRSQPPAEATTPAPAAALEDEPLPTLQKSRAPLALGVVAVLAVLGGGAWFALGQAPSTPPPARPPPALAVEPHAAATTPTAQPTPGTTATPPPGVKPPTERARLSITSVPPGAEVYEADVLLGTTPLTLQRPIDTVAELRFELAGFQKVTRKVGFSADTSVNVALEASKRGPATSPTTTTTTPRPPAGQGELKDAPF